MDNKCFRIKFNNNQNLRENKIIYGFWNILKRSINIYIKNIMDIYTLKILTAYNIHFFIIGVFI
jgi:hypothetical protein